MRILILDADEDVAGVARAIRARGGELRDVNAIAPTGARYAFAGWRLDETERNLICPAGRRIDLTASEFDLLMAFLLRPGRVLSRDMLLALLRGREWTYFDRSIDTLVARLRKKLAEGVDRPPLVRSVRGVGYVFCASVSRRDDAGQAVAA